MDVEVEVGISIPRKKFSQRSASFANGQPNKRTAENKRSSLSLISQFDNVFAHFSCVYVFIRVCSLFCFCFSFFCGKMKGEPKKSIYIYIRKRSLQARQPLPTPVFPTIFPAVSRLPFFLTCHAFFPSQTPPLILPRQWENSRQTFFRFACNSSSLQRR